jgi:two-component system response regulator FixJ
LSFALVLLFGAEFMPWLFIAPVLADGFVRGFALPVGAEVAAAVIIGGGYAAATGLLLLPRLGFAPTLASRNSLVLLAATVVGSTAVVATSYVAMLVAFGILPPADFGSAALRFWVGDAIGITVLTPFLLALMTRRRLLPPSWEAFALLVLVLGALWIVFGFTEALRFQLFYLFFLPVIWTAVRFGLEGVTVGLLLTQPSSACATTVQASIRASPSAPSPPLRPQGPMVWALACRWPAPSSRRTAAGCRSKAAPAAQWSPSRSHTRPPKAAAMTIALIEDDEPALESLRLLLEGRGLRVCGFATVEAFLAGLDEGPPECVVSDVRLPGLSGLDLQRVLKARGRNVPVILITGHGDIAMAVTAMKEGAFDFVEKPYDAEYLIANIKRALAAGQEHRSRDSQRQEFVERLAELSPCQREVMHLVADGLSNKEIAFRLGISPGPSRIIARGSWSGWAPPTLPISYAKYS